LKLCFRFRFFSPKFSPFLRMVYFFPSFETPPSPILQTFGRFPKISGRRLSISHVSPYSAYLRPVRRMLSQRMQTLPLRISRGCFLLKTPVAFCLDRTPFFTAGFLVLKDGSKGSCRVFESEKFLPKQIELFHYEEWRGWFSAVRAGGVASWGGVSFFFFFLRHQAESVSRGR